MSTAPGEGPARNLRSAARGNRRFQATATGEWRVIDGTGSEATSRKLTTEELNEFAAEHEDMEAEVLQLGHEVKNLREQLETIRREKNEAQASMAQQVDIRGTEGAEGKRGESDVDSLEEAAESMVMKRLTPLQNMIEDLARSVATVMQGATTARQLEDTSVQSGPVPVPGQQHQKDITGSSIAKVLSTGSSHYLTDWGGMKIGEANRLYKDNLSAVSVKKTGDANFAATRACWDRLIEQYPVSEGHQPKLIVHAFEGVAATVFQKIAATHPSASATQLWDLMQARLYNSAQVATQRARFTAAVMQKDETVEEFAERLRGLACGLPEATSDDVLLQRLRDGLPSSLKVNALSVTGEFDAVVSQVGQIAEAITAASSKTRHAGFAREHVNVVRGKDRETGDQEWSRDRSRPLGSLENPVGFSPANKEDVRAWNRARLCFKCRQYGHIRVGATEECGWPEALQPAGNGLEGNAGPAHL
jgi:Retrotransposon gag protein